MLKRLSFNFYFRYGQNAVKRNKIKRGIISIFCTLAVAFCGMSFGFLGEISTELDGNMKNISERLLVLVNDSVGEGTKSTVSGVPFQDLVFYKPIPSQDFKKIKNINGIESIEPVIIFPSFSTIVEAFAPGGDGFDEEKIERIETCNISFSNADGLSEQRVVRMALSEELKPGELTGSFYALSCPSIDYVEQRCQTIDSAVSKGIYISDVFAGQLGILPEHLNQLNISVDLCVPICRLDNYGFLGDIKTEFYDDFYTQIAVKFPVRGIFTSSNLLYSFYMPSELMLEIMEKAKEEKFYEASSYLKAYNETLIDRYGEAKLLDWSPNTYYITVENVADIESVKNGISQIDPNYIVAHEYQDIDAGKEIIDNTHNVMVYISFAILSVVLLLTALVYVSLIDKRKYEFAVLRANGLTKREVRRVVYAEMALQFALIFVAGLLFAALIYFIGGRWLGYPFQFDGLTVLWLFLISLGAVVLPTVISLLFVNRLEPDQVMRN